MAAQKLLQYPKTILVSIAYGISNIETTVYPYRKWFESEVI